MSATLPTPDLQQSTNYPPALAEQIVKLFDQGAFTLKLPIGFATADAAVLYTVPVGRRVIVGRAFWEVTSAFTGGTSSTIGLSSSATGYTTKGDLLGDAAGDAQAALTAGFRGAIGNKLASNGIVVLPGEATIRFDRITSAFTAGAGFAIIPLRLLP